MQKPLVLALAVAALLSVTACKPGDSVSSTQADTAPEQSQSTPAPSGPAPDAQQQKQLLKELRAVSPVLDAQRSIGRAEHVCSELLATGDDGGIANDVETTFAPAAADLRYEQALKIVKIVRESAWCR